MSDFLHYYAWASHILLVMACIVMTSAVVNPAEHAGKISRTLAIGMRVAVGALALATVGRGLIATFKLYSNINLSTTQLDELVGALTNTSLFAIAVTGIVWVHGYTARRASRNPFLRQRR